MATTKTNRVVAGLAVIGSLAYAVYWWQPRASISSAKYSTSDTIWIRFYANGWRFSDANKVANPTSAPFIVFREKEHPEFEVAGVRMDPDWDFSGWVATWHFDRPGNYIAVVEFGDKTYRKEFSVVKASPKS